MFQFIVFIWVQSFVQQPDLKQQQPDLIPETSNNPSNTQPSLNNERPKYSSTLERSEENKIYNLSHIQCQSLLGQTMCEQRVRTDYWLLSDYDKLITFMEQNGIGYYFKFAKHTNTSLQLVTINFNLLLEKIESTYVSPEEQIQLLKNIDSKFIQKQKFYAKVDFDSLQLKTAFFQALKVTKRTVFSVLYSSEKFGVDETIVCQFLQKTIQEMNE
ncbi:Hypothetical_protein [Hexamita inflata]|uniref:Hypothetical_protein n=1 Tax=Hexamita inflata TaxID=28002 RepID=A0AA86UAG2_9EUKA|nr:Hypothetical protein HINF_LOCUS37470 [Hexamita inflata]